MSFLAHDADPPRAGLHAPRLVLAALALLGFGLAVFADHIVSYYLVQWAPTLRRFPTHEERIAVLQALALDRVALGSMSLAFAASLFAWRAASRRGEARPETATAASWAALGVSAYALLRVLVESQLEIGLVRVPNVAVGIDWHGPGFAVAGLALLLASLPAVRPAARGRGGAATDPARR